MNEPSSDHSGLGATYSCPICGNSLPSHPALAPYDAPCSECGFVLWCRKRTVDGVVILEALPGRTPGLWDVEQVAESVLREGIEGVVFDLGLLDFVSTSLVARLVTLNKRVRAANRRLVLCQMRPIVRELFTRFRLHTAFDIVDHIEDALQIFGQSSVALA
jgi:anti-anti-sigma factor